MLANFAADEGGSRGRLFVEPESAHRTPFQRDRDRIIHCSAFRRLKHKTQVFVEHEGDYFRTRLTHSIEVAQVARTMARTLGLNEDLTEAVALAHDLGHTPFGHTGEDMLHSLMEPYGGFDHNAQAIKIVTELEQHYAEFDGLNLTWETLEGIAKHNGPLAGAGQPPLHYVMEEYCARHDLELDTYASAEAQVAALSDDIAYNNHDLHDGLRAGLFTEDAMRELPIVSDCFALVDQLYPGLEKSRRRHEALRRVFGVMVGDVLETSAALLKASGAETSDDIRALDHMVIRFSPEMWEKLKVIRAFFFDHMYRHWSVRRMRRKASRVVEELFEDFMADPGMLPDEWRTQAMHARSETIRARVVADYIAGMTDRFALEEHRKLRDPGETR
ncbi:MAG: deoxyguanosinetriphosphate triphosphohydrolase [Pseudomonadota bacterium]